MHYVLTTLVFAAYLAVAAVYSLALQWFRRRLRARFQNRLGPKYTGPAGLLQPFADFLKLLSKEDIELRHCDNTAIAAMLVVSSALAVLNLFFLPLLGRPLISFEGDLILVVVLSSTASALASVAAWLTESHYSRVGAARLLFQLLAIDLPLLVLALTPATLTGSLSIGTISARIPGLLTTKPLMAPVWFAAFVLMLLTVVAEAEDNPFSIPHAETEVVAGYYTEFSGRKLALVHLVHDVHYLSMAALTAAIYLGAGSWLSGFLAFPVSAVEIFAVAAAMVLISSVTSRLRMDQMLALFWKGVTPLALMTYLVSRIGAGVLIW